MRIACLMNKCCLGSNVGYNNIDNYMKQIEITDIAFERHIATNTYEWLFVGVGCESRVQTLIEKILAMRVNIKNALLLYYDDARVDLVDAVECHLRHGKINVVIEKIEADSSKRIWKLLNKYLTQVTESSNIIIDYSSMARSWYSAILLWFRESPRSISCASLYFLYAVGKYSLEIADKDVVIGQIETLPGCEGESNRHARTVIVFGLGFYGSMALCACEQLEPDVLYTIATQENPIDGVVIEDRFGNKDLVRRAAQSFRLNVGSVAMAYRCLADVANRHLARGEAVILVPMGPKTHVLASILVSLSNRSVCSLRVRHDQYKSDISASGEVIMTKVRFVDIDMPYR